MPYKNGRHIPDPELPNNSPRLNVTDFAPRNYSYYEVKRKLNGEICKILRWFTIYKREKDKK